MRYSATRNDGNVLHQFASVIILTLLLWLVYTFSGELSFANSYTTLSNLKSYTESGKFISPSEPLPVVILYYWKHVTGLNYLTAFHLFVALLFSLVIHLVFSLLQQSKWKMNQYFSLFLIATIPYFYEIPFVMFNELVVVFVFALLMKIAKEWNLVSFFGIFLLAYISINSALLAGIFFVSAYFIFLTVKKGREQRMKTTVFFKKKDIPGMMLIAYFIFLVVLLIWAVKSDFFGVSGFSFVVSRYFFLLRYLLPLVLAMALVSFLFNEEKELNGSISTAIIIVLAAVCVYYDTRKKEFNPDELHGLKKQVDALRASGKISSRLIYGDSLHRDFMYFHTSLLVQTRGIPDKRDFLIVPGIWKADRKEIDNNYKIDSYYQYYQLDNRTVLMNRVLFDRIIKNNSPAAVAFLLKERMYNKNEKETAYELYLKKLDGDFAKN